MCLSLILAFAACGTKDDKKDDSKPSESSPSSNNSPSEPVEDNDPTQDFDNDDFYEGGDLTDEEKDELLEDFKNNVEVEIVVPDADDSNDTTPDSEPEDDKQEEGGNVDNGMGDSDTEIGASRPSIW